MKRWSCDQPYGRTAVFAHDWLTSLSPTCTAANNQLDLPLISIDRGEWGCRHCAFCPTLKRDKRASRTLLTGWDPFGGVLDHLHPLVGLQHVLPNERRGPTVVGPRLQSETGNGASCWGPSYGCNFLGVQRHGRDPVSWSRYFNVSPHPGSSCRAGRIPHRGSARMRHVQFDAEGLDAAGRKRKYTRTDEKESTQKSKFL